MLYGPFRETRNPEIPPHGPKRAPRCSNCRLVNMMKEMTFHFCQGCGAYRRAEKAGRSFVLVTAPTCLECNQPLQMTGLAVMLIGIVVSLPISLALCAGATEVGEATFLGFTAMAVMRWIRQSRARRRHAANQASEVPARKLPEPRG